MGTFIPNSRKTYILVEISLWKQYLKNPTRRYKGRHQQEHFLAKPFQSTRENKHPRSWKVHYGTRCGERKEKYLTQFSHLRPKAIELLRKLVAKVCVDCRPTCTWLWKRPICLHSIQYNMTIRRNTGEALNDSLHTQHSQEIERKGS